MKESFNFIYLLLFTLFSLFSKTCIAEGKTFYVSVDGNDKKQGTQSDPFRSINHASKLAEPGDKIFVMNGQRKIFANEKNYIINGVFYSWFLDWR